MGVGDGVSIAELAELLKQGTGSRAEIAYDHTKPDGTPRKLLDVSRLHALRWRHRVGLEDRLRQTYRWYLANLDTARG